MDISGSTVLVTGGAGLIGSHLVDMLLERGCRVKILDNLEPQTHVSGKPEWIPDTAEFIYGIVQQTADLEKALTGVDFVFHQAAFTASPVEYSKFMDSNVTGTAKIYELIAKKCFPVKKIVVASSQAIYGEGKYSCTVHGVQYPKVRKIEQLRKHQWDPVCSQCNQVLMVQPTDEFSTKNGITAYAMSKYAEENIALTLGRKINAPTVALRYAVTYGPRQCFSNVYAGVVSVFASRLVNDLPPVIYEDGLQKRDWIYVEDIARANLFAVEDDRTDFEVYNVGTGVPTTVLQIAKILAESLENDIAPHIGGEFRPGDIRHLIHDTSKLKALGFEPQISFDEGIVRFLKWFKQLRNIKEYYSDSEDTLKKTGVVVS